MAESMLEYEVKDRVAYVRLNRPDRRNALNTEMCLELAKVWGRMEEDPEVRVAILSGAGDSFCMGADLSPGALDLKTIVRIFPANGVEIFKPIISAVQGYVIGAGYALAIRGCDMCVAADSAKFGFPEAKVGVLGGLVQYMPHMPFKISMEFLMTGESMPAQRAYEVGLVNRLVPENQLMDAANELADKLKRNAPMVLKAIKYSQYKAVTADRSAAHERKWEFETFIRPIHDSHDREEGARALMEKRAPEFKGE